MNNKSFEYIDEVDDVRILIKVKGKHYSIIPSDVFTKDEAKEMRVVMLRILLQSHEVVDTPLEDLKEKLQEQIK